MRFRILAALAFAFALAAQAQPQPPTPIEAAQAAQASGTPLRVEPRVQRIENSRGLPKEGHLRGSRARAFTLPAPSQAKVAQELGTPQKGVPLRIGISRDIPGLDTEGGTQSSLDWQRLADGSLVADIQVTSEGAESVRAGLRVASIPAQAIVRFQAPGDTKLFEVTGQEIEDALAANAAAGEKGPDAQTYWSPVFEGTSVVVEVDLPPGADPAAVRIAMPKVAHLATSITKDFTTQASATCERDATCSIATWGNQMNAVARMIFSDGTYSYACSGTLLADQDPASNVPYFLSANHCINTQAAATSLTTYWFYRSTACNSGVVGPYKQLSGGATLLYHTTATDTSFMRLNATPPAGAVYAGWYVGSTPAVGSAVTGLHHPGADMLKITSGQVGGYLDCTPPTNGSFSCSGGTASSSTFYDVGWTSGITEPGSSGSGLFLGNGYLVGQLYGGSSSCTSLGEDAYGRFDVAYNNGLKKWLAAAPTTQTLTVAKAGTGSGTVTSSPAGINCGATCSAPFASGSAVALSAAPATGSRFGGWSGACSGTAACSVTMNSAQSVTATFVPNTVTLGVTNAGGGTVTSSPAGINCTASCSASFTAGTAVTLTATPATGYTFGGWSGPCTGTGACTITLNNSVTVGTTFTPVNTPPPPPPTGGNVALASAGAVASASSSYSANYAPSAVNNGDRSGAGYGRGGIWNDSTRFAYPDWVQIQFAGPQSIDRVVVYSMQDNYSAPVDPSDTLTFNNYGVVDFTVQGWNGSAWVTLGTVSGNNLVKRTVTFAATTTDRVRVVIGNSKGGYSRLAEVEAFSAGSGPTSPALANAGIALTATPNPSVAGQPVSLTASLTGTAGTPSGSVSFTDGGAAISGCTGVALAAGIATCTTSALSSGTHSIVASYGGDSAYNPATSAALSQTVEVASTGGGTETNVALASAGGVATASSYYNANYPPSAVNNGDRSGAGYGHGGIWNDATRLAYPDWVQIQLAGPKTIDRVIVYSMQDAYSAPSDPSDTLTFSNYGVVDFTVEGWNGSAWVTLGSVTGNNLVKRAVIFPATSTDRIRVVVTNAKGGYSRLAEVEVWGS